MIALSRTKTDRVVRVTCICGQHIEIHGQVDAEYVAQLPHAAHEWICAKHSEPVVARTRTVPA